jgi:hypothetical protein
MSRRTGARIKLAWFRKAEELGSVIAAYKFDDIPNGVKVNLRYPLGVKSLPEVTIIHSWSCFCKIHHDVPLSDGVGGCLPLDVFGVLFADFAAH